MKLLIHTVALAGALAAPALAQDAGTDYGTMTCADFSAMDSAGQSDAVQGLQASMGGTEAGSAGAMEAEGAAGDAGEAAAEAGVDDTTIVAGTEPAEPPTAATEGQEADARLNQDAVVVSEAEADDALMLSGVMSACADDPSMMVTDAMTSAQGG